MRMESKPIEPLRTLATLANPALQLCFQRSTLSDGNLPGSTLLPPPVSSSPFSPCVPRTALGFTRGTSTR